MFDMAKSLSQVSEHCQNLKSHSPTGLQHYVQIRGGLLLARAALLLLEDVALLHRQGGPGLQVVLLGQPQPLERA